jgi:hypothetical protein
MFQELRGQPKLILCFMCLFVAKLFLSLFVALFGGLERDEP